MDTTTPKKMLAETFALATSGVRAGAQAVAYGVSVVMGGMLDHAMKRSETEESKSLFIDAVKENIFKHPAASNKVNKIGGSDKERAFAAGAALFDVSFKLDDAMGQTNQAKLLKDGTLVVDDVQYHHFLRTSVAPVRKGLNPDAQDVLADTFSGMMRSKYAPDLIPGFKNTVDRDGAIVFEKNTAITLESAHGRHEDIYALWQENKGAAEKAIHTAWKDAPNIPRAPV